MDKRIIEIIREYVGEGTEIKAEMNLLTDLGLTSFDLATMSADFEEEFGISLETSEMMEIKTVQDIEACIQRHI